MGALGFAGDIIGLGIGAGTAIATANIHAKGARRVAQENRDFQERMSNTAYQRATVDLEEAGLNRILALGSPSTTPAGSVAQPPDYSGVASSAVSGFRAGQDRRRLKEDIKSMKETRTKDRTQSESNIANAELSRMLKFKAHMDGNLAQVSASNVMSQTKLRNVEAALASYELNAARQKSIIDGSPAGRGMSWVRRMMGSMIGK